MIEASTTDNIIIISIGVVALLLVLRYWKTILIAPFKLIKEIVIDIFVGKIIKIFKIPH